MRFACLVFFWYFFGIYFVVFNSFRCYVLGVVTCGWCYVSLSHSLVCHLPLSLALSLSLSVCPALVACVVALRVKCAHCAELLQPCGVSSAADAALGGQRAVGLVVQTQLVLLLLLLLGILIAQLQNLQTKRFSLARYCCCRCCFACYYY